MSTPTVSELYLACRNGDMETVKRLLPKTEPRILNQLETNGSTCLHAACYHGHKDVVRYLLSHGASRRVVNHYGCTPLDEAKTQEIADLFPRANEEAHKRFSNTTTQQLEWQFLKGNAEAYSRAIHWNCVRDRGVKKTVKKLFDARVLEGDDEKSAELVEYYFDRAEEENNPIWLLKAYTVESQFYRQLNREMATGSERKVFEKLCKGWTGYYTGIILRNAAFEPYRYSGETYRGMEITPEDFAQYKLKQVITNKSFQSTSKSWKVAKSFACPPTPSIGKLSVILILIIIDRRSALSIEEISEFKNEAEVLIAPGTLFIVKNIDHNRNPCEIELLQLEWTNEF